MIRQSEFKMRYDPDIGRYVKKHIHTGEIHGEGLTDIFKSIGNKLFGKTAKEMTKKAATTAATSAATKTGKHMGNWAGDKIVQLLRKEQQPKQETVRQTISETAQRPLSELEIAARVNRLISGGRIKKRLFFI